MSKHPDDAHQPDTTLPSYVNIGIFLLIETVLWGFTDIFTAIVGTLLMIWIFSRAQYSSNGAH